MFTSRALGSDDTTAFVDATLASALRWRLGMQQDAGPTRRCKLAPCGRAGEAEDEAQQRALRGAAFKIRHDPNVEQLGYALRDLGCQARVECSMLGVFCKNGKTIAPGRLDACAFGQGGLVEVMIDVEVKRPRAGPHPAARCSHRRQRSKAR